MGSNSEDDNLEDIKYNYTVLEEFSDKELLSMEKEMLGLYITGHPLEPLRDELEAQTTINTFKMTQINEEEQEEGGSNNTGYRDGQIVKIAGLVSSVKKKYTKTNKIMAFTTIEDLYGQCEMIVFENCYQMCSDFLMEGNIVISEGRLSIREDEDTKIVANKITEFKGENHHKNSNVVTIDITNLSDEQKDKLRGAIRFFAGDRNNCRIDIKNGERIDSAGGVLMNESIFKEFKEIVGSDNIS
jgi:DNA polymerase-3 subunit alpha